MKTGGADGTHGRINRVVARIPRGRVATYGQIARLAGLRGQARLVGFNPGLDINCVLLVDRLSGLRSEKELAPEPEEELPRPAFVGKRFRDAAGRLWQELNLAALAGDEAFLGIVGPRHAEHALSP